MSMHADISRHPAPGLYLNARLSPYSLAYNSASLRLWALPAVALFTMLAIHTQDLNQILFLAINQTAVVLPNQLWANLTTLGDTLVALTLLLPFLRRRADAAAAVIIAVALATLGTHALKFAFDLPRPLGVIENEWINVIGPHLKYHAFPSGHTTSAFAILALMAGYTMTWRTLRWLLLLAMLVGFSRIAVGVHWPIDVLGGMALGWLSGFAGLHLAPYCQHVFGPALRTILTALMIIGAVWLMTTFNSGYADARMLERMIAIAALLLFAFPELGKRGQMMLMRTLSSDR